jgi:hypothetical protein
MARERSGKPKAKPESSLTLMLMIHLVQTAVIVIRPEEYAS